MRRTLTLAAVFLAAALTVFLGLELLGDHGADRSEPALEGAASPEREIDPELVGTGAVGEPQADEDPFAHETDLEILVQQSWAGSPAQARLLELARGSALTLAELIEWLRPEHDAARARPGTAGQRYSGRTGMPQLNILGDTLARLAPEVVPLLVAALADEDPVFRERVADVLGRMGAAAAPAVSALVARLEPGEEDVRGQVVMLQALGNLGRAAVDATPVLLSYLEDDGLPDDARAAAAEGIFRVVGTTPAAFAACAVALGDQSYEVCTRLIPSLGDLGAEAAPVVPELVGIVLDPTANDGVQRLAMEALGCIGTSDEVAGHALLTIALDDAEEEWVRWSALSALSQLGGDAVGNLLKQLSSAGPDTRCLAVRALAEAKTVAPDTLLALLEPLRKSKWPEERWMALRAGVAVRGESSVLVPWLARWMEDDTLGMRVEVLQRATRLADDSGRVVDLLASALGDEDPDVRCAGLQGLLTRAEWDRGDRAALGRTAVVDAVRDRLTDPQPILRFLAASWIAQVAPTYDVEALPVWIRMLEEGHVEDETLRVLTRLGPKAKSAVPALERALERTTWAPGRAQIQTTINALRGK